MNRILGIIIMGGKALRLGAVDKSAQMIGEMSLMEHVNSALSQGTDTVALSIVSAPQAPQSWQGPIITDQTLESAKSGPAIAIFSSLVWAKTQGYDAVITSPVDTPFIPSAYAHSLIKASIASANSSIICEYQGAKHGLHALWPVAALPNLKEKVISQGVMKISALHDSLHSTPLNFDHCDRDPFFNVNTPEDLEAARRLYAGLKAHK